MANNYQEQNECSYCFATNQLTYTFPCYHHICSKCLYRHIFCFHIQELNNTDKINVKCKCSKDDYLQFNMNQLQELMINLEENKEEVVTTCKNHKGNNSIFYFCKNCNKYTCYCCHFIPKEEHYGHRFEPKNVLSTKMKNYLQDFVTTIPPQEVFKSMIERYSEQVKQIAEQDFQETMKSITQLIRSLQEYQREYVEKYKTEMEKVVYNIKILNMFYSRFYSDLKDIDNGDIYFLKYLNNIKCLFAELELKHKPVVDQTLSNIKVQVEDLKRIPSFLTTEFKFKDIGNQFKLINIVQNAHTLLIKSIIQLSDDKLVTGSEDERLKIWEEKERGYECIITLQNFIGVINALLPLKDKRFASAGTKRDIKIWCLNENECDCRQSLPGHNDDITSLASLKDGRMISGGKDWNFLVWKEVNNEFELVLKIPESDTIYNIIPLYDSRLIITTKSDINLWKEDGRKFTNVQKFPKIKSLIKAICQLKDGKLAIGGKSRQLYIWEETETNVFKMKQASDKKHKADINAIVELNGGNIATASSDRQIFIWKKNSISRNYELAEEVSQFEHGLYCMILLKDGRLCTATSTHCLVLYKDRSDYN